MKAYLDQVNLSAQGFYRDKDLEFDWTTGKGHPYSYYTYGVACSEVEVDVLTGNFTLLQTDLLMDLGNSINPAIDIGQVEGAFTQGLGLFTMEEPVYLEGNPRTQRGQPFTIGPSQYKIPGFSDVPVEFNVSLLDRAPNSKAIFSSKVCSVSVPRVWGKEGSTWPYMDMGRPPTLCMAIPLSF